MHIKISDQYILTTGHSSSCYGQPVLMDVRTGAAFGAADIVSADDIFMRTAADLVARDLPYRLDSKQVFDAAEQFCQMGGTTLRAGVYSYATA